jgi:hypothetical protein
MDRATLIAPRVTASRSDAPCSALPSFAIVIIAARAAVSVTFCTCDRDIVMRPVSSTRASATRNTAKENATSGMTTPDSPRRQRDFGPAAAVLDRQSLPAAQRASASRSPSSSRSAR